MRCFLGYSPCHSTCPPRVSAQTRPGLRGRVAAYHGDLSVQARRDVHAAFMHDRLTVGGRGVAAAGGKLVVRAPLQALVCSCLNVHIAMNALHHCSTKVPCSSAHHAGGGCDGGIWHGCAFKHGCWGTCAPCWGT